MSDTRKEKTKPTSSPTSSQARGMLLGSLDRLADADRDHDLKRWVEHQRKKESR